MKVKVLFMKKVSLKFTICIVVIVAILSSVATLYLVDNFYLKINKDVVIKLNTLQNLLDKEYYYALNNDDFADSVANAYVTNYGDKYAKYYTKEEAVEQQAKTVGESYGIGIQAVGYKNKGSVYVWRVFKNSTADIAGIKSGDIITGIDGKSTLNLGFSKSIAKISGSKGKEVKLTILRGDSYKKITVKCADNEVQSVYAKLIKSKKLGYLQVTEFNKKTYMQFKTQIEEFENSGAKGYIIDLRHNGGGTVDAAAKMLDLILPKGDTIRVKTKDGKITVRNSSKKSSINKPFVILQDGATASASEIFISAMRDFGAATIIGEKTYGKSVIQRYYELDDGSRVKFTVAEFVNKKGKSFNEVGIKPDIDMSKEMPTANEYFYLTEESDVVFRKAVETLLN